MMMRRRIDGWMMDDHCDLVVSLPLSLVQCLSRIFLTLRKIGLAQDFDDLIKSCLQKTHGKLSFRN